MINMVDEFVIYDDAQYTKRDWRNRNRIKTVNGAAWVTIPVEVKNRYTQSIRETKVSGNTWVNKHLKMFRQNYTKAKYFEDTFELLNGKYRLCEDITLLSEINLVLIGAITEYLGIKTKISRSSDYNLEGNKSDKLLNICIQAGAKEYLSGPSAKSYLDEDAFNKEGITLKWMDYSGYKEYTQLYSPFIHELSIIDLMFNTGRETTKYMNSFS